MAERRRRRSGGLSTLSTIDLKRSQQPRPECVEGELPSPQKISETTQNTRYGKFKKLQVPKWLTSPIYIEVFGVI